MITEMVVYQEATTQEVGQASTSGERCTSLFPRHRLKFEFHAKQANGSEFSVEMRLGFEAVEA